MLLGMPIEEEEVIKIEEDERGPIMAPQYGEKVQESSQAYTKI